MGAKPRTPGDLQGVADKTAEQGLHEGQVPAFPASYCNDGGLRINNAEPDWPESLEGFAKGAYEFFTREPKPLGYKTRADRRLSRRKASRRWALPRLVEASPGPVSGGDR
jgi:hypothetical protein